MRSSRCSAAVTSGDAARFTGRKAKDHRSRTASARAAGPRRRAARTRSFRSSSRATTRTSRPPSFSRHLSHPRRKQAESTPETLMEHLGDDEEHADLAHKLLSGAARTRRGRRHGHGASRGRELRVFAPRIWRSSNRIMRDQPRGDALPSRRAIPSSFKELAYEQLETRKNTPRASAANGSKCDILFRLNRRRGGNETNSRPKIVI